MKYRRTIGIVCACVSALAASSASAVDPSSVVLRGSVQPGSIAAGWYHSLGLKSNGTAVAWGLNTFGQRNVTPPNTNFIAIAGGGLHTLAVKSNGTIVAWGRNSDGQTNVPAPNANFVSVAGGGSHSLGLKSDGTVVAWGLNTSGQTNVPSPNANFRAIAAGWNHSLALRSNGTMAVWGSDNYGQSTLPSSNTNFVAIACGGYHSLGLKSNGSIITWGRSAEGQLEVPLPNSNFVAIAAGLYHSMGLKSDGTVVVWGDDLYEQTTVPVPNDNFIAVAANGYHSLALRADGSVVAWGRNTDGQTNVPATNANFGVAAPVVFPSSGPVTGGYAVSISGYFLNADITNVMLAGIQVASIVNQSATQIVVMANAAVGPVLGDVRVFSLSSGEMVLSNAFRYIGEQTILFPAIADQITTNKLGLAATTTSGLPVSFSVLAGPASLAGGTNVTFSGSGTVTLVASQGGNENWYPAHSVSNTFSVTKALAAVNLQNLMQTYNGEPRVVDVSTLPEGLSVSITYNGSSNAPIAVGNYGITGVVNDVMYQGMATGTLVVGKASAIVFLDDLVHTYDGLTKAAVATSMPDGLTILVTYNGATSHPANAGSYAVTGTVMDVNYAGSATALLFIAKADQFISFDEISNQITTNHLGLAATASSGLPVSFGVAAGPAVLSGGTNLTFTGSGLVAISASQAGDGNWNPAGGSLAFFNVDRADQFITFPAIGDQIPTNKVELSAEASSGLPVSFSIISGPAYITNVTNVVFTDFGEITVAATQSGDAIWNAAPGVTNTFIVEGLFLLTISSGPHGTVDVPTSWREPASVVQITALPEPYHYFAGWSGDVPEDDMFANPLHLLMDESKTIFALFVEDTTSGGIPVSWLVAHGITNDFEQAVLLDPDEDGVITGDEYITDTDPLDGDSFLASAEIRSRPTASGFFIALTVPVSTNRNYNLESSVAVTGSWQSVAGLTNLAPTSTSLVLTNLPVSDPMRFYRLRAKKM